MGLNFTEAWLRLNGSVHVVLYDELKRDLRHQLTSILKFLDFPLTYIECAMVNSEGKFHRRKKHTVDVATLVSDYDTKRLIEENNWRTYETVYSHRRLFPPH